MIGHRIGNYEVLRTLGEGGMGVVYLARHALLGRLAAIKLLLPELSSKQEMVARMFNEARLMAALHHPGLVDVYDFGHHEGRAYLIMEYLEGETLAQLIDRVGRLPLALAVALGRQIAAAMAVAHLNGVIHRDLKPDNVFLVRDDEISTGLRARLLDFGVAKLVQERGGAARTRTGSLVGTPAYMSPEQCRGAGSAEIDARSDIYALGLCAGPYQSRLAAPRNDSPRHTRDRRRLPEKSPRGRSSRISVRKLERVPRHYRRSPDQTWATAEGRGVDRRKGTCTGDRRCWSAGVPWRVARTTCGRCRAHDQRYDRRDDRERAPGIDQAPPARDNSPGQHVGHGDLDGRRWCGDRLRGRRSGRCGGRRSHRLRSRGARRLHLWKLARGLVLTMTKRMKLVRAIRRGDRAAVRALVASGAPVDSRRTRDLLWQEVLPPLDEAVLANVPEIVSDLLDHGADPNGGERPGAPLAYACGRAAFPIIELLVGRGALVDPPAHPRRISPLNAAVTQRHVDVMEWLLARGANPNDVFAGTVVLDRLPASILLRLIEAGGKAPEDVERRVKAGNW